MTTTSNPESAPSTDQDGGGASTPSGESRPAAGTQTRRPGGPGGGNRGGGGGGRRPWGRRKVCQFCVDHIDHIDYKRHIDWEHFYEWSQKNKFRLILMTTKTNQSFYNFEFLSSDILLFGRESSGVPDNIHQIVVYINS